MSILENKQELYNLYGGKLKKNFLIQTIIVIALACITFGLCFFPSIPVNSGLQEFGETHEIEYLEKYENIKSDVLDIFTNYEKSMEDGVSSSDIFSPYNSTFWAQIESKIQHSLSTSQRTELTKCYLQSKEFMSTMTYNSDDIKSLLTIIGIIVIFIFTIIEPIILLLNNHTNLLLHDIYNKQNKSTSYLKTFARKGIISSASFSIFSLIMYVLKMFVSDTLQISRHIVKPLSVVGAFCVITLLALIIIAVILKKQTNLLRKIEIHCDQKYGADRCKIKEQSQEDKEPTYKVQLVEVKSKNYFAIWQLITENWGKLYTDRELRQLIKSNYIAKEKITKPEAEKIADDAKFLGANAIVSKI